MTNFKIKKQRRGILYFLLFGCLLSTSSCVSTRGKVYLQGAHELFHNPREIEQRYELYIQPDDRLYITVSTKDKELLEPFGNNQALGSGGNLSSISGQQQTGGVLVDEEGYIRVPILGKIQAGGLTCNELAEDIKKRLSAGEYIKNPVVNVRLIGVQVAVLGEVGSPGIKTFSGTRITLPEALSMAGDLTAIARRDNILVIREENGKRIAFSVDLTSAKNVFASPVYYLRQNDLVYVEPNKTIALRGNSTLSYLGATSTVISVLASVVSFTLTVVLLNKK